jgi:hypothetical protein
LIALTTLFTPLIDLRKQGVNKNQYQKEMTATHKKLIEALLFVVPESFETHRDSESQYGICQDSFGFTNPQS